MGPRADKDRDGKNEADGHEKTQDARTKQETAKPESAATGRRNTNPTGVGVQADTQDGWVVTQ